MNGLGRPAFPPLPCTPNFPVFGVHDADDSDVYLVGWDSAPGGGGLWHVDVAQFVGGHLVTTISDGKLPKQSLNSETFAGATGLADAAAGAILGMDGTRKLSNTHERSNADDRLQLISELDIIENRLTHVWDSTSLEYEGESFTAYLRVAFGYWALCADMPRVAICIYAPIIVPLPTSIADISDRFKV